MKKILSISFLAVVMLASVVTTAPKAFAADDAPWNTGVTPAMFDNNFEGYKIAKCGTMDAAWRYYGLYGSGTSLDQFIASDLGKDAQGKIDACKVQATTDYNLTWGTSFGTPVQTPAAISAPAPTLVATGESKIAKTGTVNEFGFFAFASLLVLATAGAFAFKKQR